VLEASQGGCRCHQIACSEAFHTPLSLPLVFLLPSTVSLRVPQPLVVEGALLIGALAPWLVEDRHREGLGRLELVHEEETFDDEEKAIGREVSVFEVLRVEANTAQQVGV
jgi:hypothetical protein